MKPKPLTPKQVEALNLISGGWSGDIGEPRLSFRTLESLTDRGLISWENKFSPWSGRSYVQASPTAAGRAALAAATAATCGLCKGEGGYWTTDDRGGEDGGPVRTWTACGACAAATAEPKEPSDG